jgi:hypothetical protein
MKAFCMDVHISIIEDFKKVCPFIEVTDWCLSSHAWVMKRRQDNPLYINANTWRSLNREMIEAFQNRYHSFLRTFDFFIVGYASCFAMIYERYQKPILMLNAVRYDVPFCWSRDIAMLNAYKQCLYRLRAANQLHIVSNNKADQLYLRKGCGIASEYIPSLCMYTGIRYAPSRDTFLVYTGTVPEHRLITQKSGTPFDWSEIGSFRGIIHIPYEVSTMSMFEQFYAGIPLFFPSKAFWKSMSNIQSMSAYWADSPPPELNELRDLSIWIDLSDVYETFSSPNTHYFDSFEHLFQLLETFVYVDVKTDCVENVQKKWQQITDVLRSNGPIKSGRRYGYFRSGRILPM